MCVCVSLHQLRDRYLVLCGCRPSTPALSEGSRLRNGASDSSEPEHNSDGESGPGTPYSAIYDRTLDRDARIESHEIGHRASSGDTSPYNGMYQHGRTGTEDSPLIGRGSFDQSGGRRFDAGY